ncbi:hypothetical protein DEO72_LG10g2274 [Vigna unguiculata]|uniref:Uncharacterized protein n=1 Tax=Vigna unguiculata TaxID=3917 RepID=A0A4D6NDU0_VIGUN|nr:hypothetical protein DEO72_LG10g2274 [Vigna unguiculata]
MSLALPLSRAQLKGYVLSSTQGTPASRPLRNPERLVDHANNTSKNQLCCIKIAWRYSHRARCNRPPKRLSGDTYRQAPCALDASNLAGVT